MCGGMRLRGGERSSCSSGTVATQVGRRGLQHIKIAGILVRHYRFLSLGFRVLLLFSASTVVHGQTLLSLGASSGSGSGCNLGGGGTCPLSARVTGLSPATVTFVFAPPASVTGGTVGTPVGPN